VEERNVNAENPNDIGGLIDEKEIALYQVY